MTESISVLNLGTVNRGTALDADDYLVDEDILLLTYTYLDTVNSAQINLEQLSNYMNNKLKIKSKDNEIEGKLSEANGKISTNSTDITSLKNIVKGYSGTEAIKKAIGNFTDASSNTTTSSLHARINQAFDNLGNKDQSASQTGTTAFGRINWSIQQIKTLDTKVTTLQTRVGKPEDPSSATELSLYGRIKDVNSKITTVNNSVTKLTSTVNGLSPIVNNLSGHMYVLSKQIAKTSIGNEHGITLGKIPASVRARIKNQPQYVMLNLNFALGHSDNEILWAEISDLSETETKNTLKFRILSSQRTAQSAEKELQNVNVTCLIFDTTSPFYGWTFDKV